MYVMRVSVEMRMRMDHSTVRMSVGVDQVCSKQQVAVGENLGWGAIGDDRSLFQNEHTIRDVFDDFKLVGRAYNSLERTFPVLNQVHDMTCASRVECSSGFVK